jgi:hypothetical protein
MNTGAFQKFSGQLNLRDTNYIGKVHILIPEHTYHLNSKTILKALNAYHDEVITKDYSVGLWFTVETEYGGKNIIISSDTSLYPPDEKGGVEVHTEREIWKTYGIDGRPIHLLIPHLGSIKEHEFTTEYKDAPKLFYRNHLGIMGTASLIEGIRPSLAIISEFGEELRSIQAKLVKLFADSIRDMNLNVKLLPGDLGLIYDIVTEQICCQLTNNMCAYHDISYDLSDEGHFNYFRAIHE